MSEEACSPRSRGEASWPCSGGASDCLCCLATSGTIRSWGQNLLQTLGWWGGQGPLGSQTRNMEETGLDVAHLCPDPCSAVSWLQGLGHLREALFLCEMKMHLPRRASVTCFTLWGTGAGGWVAVAEEATCSRWREAYLFPGATVTNYHKPGAKMRRFLLCWFRKPEIGNQDIGRIGSFGKV